jgi:N-acetyl-gamma-glutamyl-phosphate reductase
VLTTYDPGQVGAGDFACVCYPHAESVNIVAELVSRGARVVDLGADYRLRDPALYPRWYGFEHGHQDLLQDAVYGLPEAYRDAIVGAPVVANPGCYPTAAIIALLPLKDTLASAIIDAKSGVSGAGKTPSAAVHYSVVTDSIQAYKVLSHRHTPEIAQELGLRVIFTPHLVPADRGELASCYATLTGVPPDGDDLRSRYTAFYDSHPFVEVVFDPPGFRAVQRTNFAQVAPMIDPDLGVVVSFCAIDNLMKGAAGQALQNLNLMAGRPETEGLL